MEDTNYFRKEYEKNWRKANRDKIQAIIKRKKNQYKDIQSIHYKRMMLARAKNRAIKRGIPFDLTIDDIIIPDTCPIFGIELKAGKGKGASDNSPAMDKINPSLGYVKGNIHIICSRANRIKNNSTVEELSLLMEHLKSINNPDQEKDTPLG